MLPTNYGVHDRVELPAYQFRHYAYSIWLFTLSDLKTIVVPSTVFGIIIAICAPQFHLPRSKSSDIVLRIPLVVLWCWVNLLPFSIDNQRQPDAIEEDAQNKPWRPLPAERLGPKEARALMLSAYSIALGFSLFSGGLRQAIVLIWFGYCYNDLGGADRGILQRNLINAAGYCSFTFGAAEVALANGAITLTTPLLKWFSIIALVVMSTVHAQDMHDQAGDRSRGRRTMPLIIGDQLSRFTIAVPVMFWSLFCPTFWDTGILGYMTPLSLGSLVAQRILVYNCVSSDKLTFKIWNLWIISLYLLPLF